MSFTLDVKAFCDKAKKNPETVMRAVSIKLFSDIIFITPVGEKDGGALRMNWQASGSNPASGEVAGLDPGNTKAKASMIEFISNSKDWYEFTLTNNKSYAAIVEYGGYPGDGPNTVGGYSKQAPAGMVRTNITRFNTLLNEEAAKVK